MTPSCRLYNFLSKLENFRARSYICPGGEKTIGYGHVIKKEEKIKEPINTLQAMELLEKDIIQASDAVNKYIKHDLNQDQFDSLVSFVFNVGTGAFSKSTLRKVINRGELDRVTDELMRWTKGNKPPRVIPGLVRRRLIEAEWFNGKAPT